MIDTLLRIRLFVAVYEERSFTAAAQREHATQSGVTQHMQKLEEHLGVMLFSRRGGTVTATPAGDLYYQACLEVLRAHARSRDVVRPYSHGLAGEVLVGLTPTLTRTVLAPALSRFVDEHPNVVVRVTDAYSDIVIDKVRAGELDFGIVPGAVAEVGLRCERFARTPEFLVCGARAGLPLVHGKAVRLSQLGPLKLVLPSQAQARRRALDAYLAQVGAVVERKLEIDSSLGALDFLAQSDWLSIHPGIMMLREMDRGDFVVSPLVEPPLTLDLFRIERASEPLSPGAMAFLQALEAQAAQMTGEAERLLVAAL
ncbi:MAG TPA: LysR family transcriptional regulator [Ramlibacter sp.]|nr:LysR family transcriptional regulator [Ramlibacter sp.]